jgi:hypothetical protein
MSDFVGAGFYRIESILDRNARVALSGGGRTDGTRVVIWFVCSTSVSSALAITEMFSRKNDPNKNDVFAFTFAGVGKSGKHEYHIINNNSGTFLTYPDGAPEGKQLEGNVLSPLNARTRWNVCQHKIHPCRTSQKLTQSSLAYPSEEPNRPVLVRPTLLQTLARNKANSNVGSPL